MPSDPWCRGSCRLHPVRCRRLWLCPAGTKTTRGRTRYARPPAPGGAAAPPATAPTTGSSSSLKIRSDDAIADCRTLNFSDMSLIGRKKRTAYWRNATSAPSVSVPRSTLAPPYQMISADDSALTDFDRRIEHRVVEDRLDVGVAVAAIDRVEPVEVQRFAPEQLHGRHAGDVLLQERVDPRDPSAHDAIRVADVAAETTA